MKSVISFLSLLTLICPLVQATSPGYTNITILRSPGPIDAKVFVNQGQFIATYLLGSGLPYDFQNTEYFWNQGVMVGQPGFRFDLSGPSGVGRRSGTFLNDRDGTITVRESSGGGLVGDVGGPFLIIDATNVINKGTITSDTYGILQISGHNVDLSRGRIELLSPFLSGSSSSVVSSNWFQPENGILDRNWGTGNVGTDCNTFMRRANGVTLIGTPNYAVTNAAGFEFLTTMDQFQPQSYVFTNKVNDTNYVVQAVFIINTDTNVNTDVAFEQYSVINPYRTVLVNLSTAATNIFGSLETRQYYIIDRLASDTNYTVFSNILTGVTYRPANYEITKDPTGGGQVVNRSKANEKLRSDLFTRFYNAQNPAGLAYSNNIVTNYYSAYSAAIPAVTTAPPVVDDSSPTNAAGRVDINADVLNLTSAKIRSESVVNINTRHLASTDGALIESQQLYYTLGTTNGQLNLRNLARKEVSGLSGTVRLYSALWTNIVTLPTNSTGAASSRARLAGAGGSKPIQAEDACPPGHNPLLSDFLGEPCTDGTGGGGTGGGGTGGGGTGGGTTSGGTDVNVVFHVLLVNADLLTRTAVELNGLFSKADNTTVGDRVAVTDALRMDTESLTVDGILQVGSVANLGGKRIANWTGTNFPTLRWLTNNGGIYVPGALSLGTDREQPYKVIHVTGTNASAGHYYLADQFDNSGLIFGGYVQDNGTDVQLFRDAAQVQIQADTMKLENGRIEAGGRVRLTAGDLKMRGHSIISDSSVSLSATRSLSDSGPGSQNKITTVYGFELPVKPTSGDLLGTTFESTPQADREAEHIWAGEDRGASKSGFLNNIAVGRVALNGDVGTTFRFTGSGAKNAIYVDFLDLSASVRENLSGSLFIADNFTIYFAAASVPIDEIDGALGGRLRWVSDYAGSNSSVEVLLRDGRTIKVNRALRESLKIDSDGDGIANGQDLFPFDGASGLKIDRSSDGNSGVTLRWNGSARTVYTIEVTSGVSGSAWTVLGTVANDTDISKTLKYTDAANAGPTSRYYRIRSTTP